MDEDEFGGPVRWETGGGADGEMDIGGEGGVTGEETRFDVNAIDLDRFGEVIMCIAKPCTLFNVGRDSRWREI